MKNLFALFALLLSTQLVLAQCPYAAKKCQVKEKACQKKSLSSCDKKVTTNEIATKRWQINAVGVTIGSFGDMYDNMTEEGMLSMANGLPNGSINSTAFSKVDNQVMIEGGSLGAYISLNPRNRTQDGYNLNQELRLGINANIEREAMIEFSDPSYNSLVYCLIENEINLSASYLFSRTFGRRFGVYGGLGMNVGSTFDNVFLLINNTNEDDTSWEAGTTEVEAKSSYYTRGFLHLGLAYHMRRISLSLDVKSGMGMQFVDGAQNNYIKDSCVGQLGVQYNFNRR